MKHYINRIISIALTVSIITVLVLSSHISSFAFSPSDFIGNLSWDKMTTTEKWGLTYNFVVAQLRALYNGDFEGYLNGMSAMEEYKSSHDPDDFVTDEGMTIPADFVALIKQALIEYANETNGFWTMPTTRVTEIDATQFTYKAQYDTLRFLTRDTGLIAVNGNAIADLTPVYEEGWAFVNTSTSYDPSSLQTCWTDIYDSDWKNQKPFFYTFTFNNTVESGYTSFDQGNYANETGWRVYWFEHFSPNYPRFNSGRIYDQTGSTLTLRNSCLISNDGRRIRVFKSLDAYKLYSVEQRSVYFGKGFYDFDPQEITATWDDIADTINHIDDILQDLLDKIDNSTDESTIEELLQQILDAIKNGGGSGDNQGSGSGSGGGSYDDKNLLALLSGYFNSVLAYLDQILAGIKALVWIDLDNKTDKDKSDLWDLIDKIWKDPETGSQEAADVLSGSFADIARGFTKKFPFSIPWDIYGLFSVFANTAPPAAQQAAYLYDDSGGTVTPYWTDWMHEPPPEVHNAPYFRLPLVVESFGIEEYVEVDMKDFQTLSTLSRTMLSLLFAVFLIKFTIKLIGLFKGGDE